MGRMMLDIHVPFLEAGLLLWLYFWNLLCFVVAFHPQCSCCSFLSRVSCIIRSRNIFQALPKMTSGLLMSVVIAVLIIQLQVIIPNDGHCLREGSGLTREPIKPCFSGFKLSSLIFSKASTNGMFQEPCHEIVAA